MVKIKQMKKLFCFLGFHKTTKVLLIGVRNVLYQCKYCNYTILPQGIRVDGLIKKEHKKLEYLIK